MKCLVLILFLASTKKGKELNVEMEKMFEKYNFEYYTSSFSISENSVNSISSLINFENTINRNELVKASDQGIFYRI